MNNVISSKKQRSVKRFIVPSDTGEFVGRVFDLSVLEMWFNSYDELAVFPDIKYAYHVNVRTSLLVSRIESLNRVGNLLWPTRAEEDLKLPMSRYDWLTMIADLLFVRLTSVFDCCLLLANEVLEIDLKPHNCKLSTLKQKGIPVSVLEALQGFFNEQERVRAERNSRVHEAWGRSLTEDDSLFRTFAQVEYLTGTTECQNPDGSKTHISEYYNVARNELRREFNLNSRALVKHLELVYQHLYKAFNARFSAKRQSHPRNHPIYGGR